MSTYQLNRYAHALALHNAAERRHLHLRPGAGSRSSPLTTVLLGVTCGAALALGFAVCVDRVLVSPPAIAALQCEVQSSARLRSVTAVEGIDQSRVTVRPASARPDVARILAAGLE